jgi:hypothetical protein
MLGEGKLATLSVRELLHTFSIFQKSQRHKLPSFVTFKPPTIAKPQITQLFDFHKRIHQTL